MANNAPLPNEIEKLIREREELRQRDREIEAELQTWARSIRERFAAVGVSLTGEPSASTGAVVALPKGVTENPPPKTVGQVETVIDIVRRMGRAVGVADVESVLKEWGRTIPRSAIRSYLSHAANDGVLERVARGQYVPVDIGGAVAYSERFAHMTLRLAAVTVLAEEGGSLHTAELYQRLVAGGAEIGGKDPKNTLYGTLQGHSAIRKVAPSVWDLAERRTTLEPDTAIPGYEGEGDDDSE